MEFVGKCLVVEAGFERILVIGDLHFGFEEAMNESGVLIIRKMFSESRDYLERVFMSAGKIHEVVLLGDIKHFFSGVARQEWKDVSGFLKYLKEKVGRVVLIQGNHDNFIRSVVKEECVEVRDYYVKKEFCFLHGDKDFSKIYDKKTKIWVVGHGHPAIKLREPRGVKIEKYKCFLVGKFKEKKIVVVPSFFDYTMGTDPRDNKLGLAWDINFENFEVFVVQEEELSALDFGKLKRIE